MKNNIFIIIAAIVLVGAGAFFAGTKYQQSKQSSFSRQFGSGQGRFINGQLQGGANRQGFRPVAGEIISNDGNTISVKLPDGSSKLVLVSDSTDINKASKSTKEDLKTGEQVAVFGTENTDGSVTAQTIQLNPMVRGFGASVSGTPRN